MINELDSLAQNIDRLITIGHRFYHSNLSLKRELEDTQTNCEQTLADLEQMRLERDALRAECEALTAKIDDAQVQLNAILEKLPHNKSNESQLNLLPPHEKGEQA